MLLPHEVGLEQVEIAEEYEVVRGFVDSLTGLDATIYRRLFVHGELQAVVAHELRMTPMQFSRAKSAFLRRAERSLRGVVIVAA